MARQGVQYLIIGGGVAGASAARAIRRVDAIGTLMIIAQEASQPYHRSRLRDYLTHKITRSDLHVMPTGWFEANHVLLRTGRTATSLDVSRSIAVLDDGDEIHFERMLMATGSSIAVPGWPGVDLPGVYALRSIEQADRISQHVQAIASEGRRPHVVIAGGDVPSTQNAAALTALPTRVSLITKDAQPWASVADDATGRHVGRAMSGVGVEVRTGRQIVSIGGSGRVQQVVFDDGQTLPADIVLLGGEMVPDRRLLRGTPLSAARAVLTDDACRTSIEHIFAAGDAAAILDPRFGKHRIVHAVEHAELTGAVAGSNMAGEHRTYDRLTAYRGVLAGLPVTVAGEARLVATRFSREDSSGVACLGLDAEGRSTHVAALGRASELDALLRMVEHREVPPAAFGDVIVPLK